MIIAGEQPYVVSAVKIIPGAIPIQIPFSSLTVGTHNLHTITAGKRFMMTSISLSAVNSANNSRKVEFFDAAVLKYPILMGDKANLVIADPLLNNPINFLTRIDLIIDANVTVSGIALGYEEPL